ncbi:MAG: hypothetical protein EOO08_13450 [Chitinophagaceae bacterium]|nr:MAG: hypothetical protein EOO08_13450 [Chitinophagaceae bacterium]
MKKLFLFGALAFSLSGFAQKVTGKIGLQKGQKLEVATETKRNATQELMGQTMESSMSSSSLEVYDVQDASATGATIEHKVKQFKFSAEGGGQAQSFDSEKPEDLKGEMGQIIDKKVLKNKYTMTIDAAGKVASVRLDDDNAAAKKKDEEQGGMAEMMAEQMGANVATPKAGDPTLFSVIPANREVGVGDTWSDSTGKDGMRMKKTYTVKSISADEVVVAFTSETRVEKTMQIMGNDASINTTDKGTGTITFDRKSGVVKLISSTSKTEGAVEAQGMTIPLTAETTTTVTVKAS